MTTRMMRVFAASLALALAAAPLWAQQTEPAQTAPATTRGARGGRGAGAGGAGRGGAAPSARAIQLRGEYGQYRANNDLLYYHLDIRIDPTAKTIAGKNTVKFKMLKDDNRIQLDLAPNLKVDKIMLGNKELKYTREEAAVFIDFPDTLKTGTDNAIDFYYSGTPTTSGRFGGFTFGKDSHGRDFLYTACEGNGAMCWWPNKEQWTDEVENMDISIEIPKDLTDVSNGRFVAKKDLPDGYTRWDWHVSYPINNYCVSVNIGTYTHFDDKFGDLTLDFYCQPENLDKAKEQFSQAKGMIEAFSHYFGEYPFAKDGYKLVEVPYTGMEHQTAVTYGNGFRNGYGNRDWTGVGISPKFDFIIIHESGHEWFGNAVSAADQSDMWIQEGWCTYLEGLYVEYRWGKDDGLKYLNGYRNKVANRAPVISRRGIATEPGQDQYFKGALFLNTLRSVIDDDKKWMALLRGTYDTFKYKNIFTEEMVAYFNKQTGQDLTPIFDQYLRHAALPALELQFDEAKGEVSYRWKADEVGFNMPIKVGTKDHWDLIRPNTKDWQVMKTSIKKDDFTIPTELYYVTVTKS